MGVVSSPRVWLRGSEEADGLLRRNDLWAQVLKVRCYGGHLSVCSVRHAPSFWNKREPMIFLVRNKELEVELTWVSAWGPLFILECWKKQVGGACFPGYIEEDKALGPSCGHWSPGLERKMVPLRSGWPHCKEEGDKTQLREDWDPAPDRWQAECHDCTIVKGRRVLLFSYSWNSHLKREVTGG